MTHSASYGLYIHVPFCIRKCSYCSFYSLEYNSSLAQKWFDSLLREIKLAIPENTIIRTVYAGGGTPGLISPGMWVAFWDALGKQADLSLLEEATIETNPAANISDDFRGFLNAGFNRISIGVQSFHDRELEILGRLHTADEAVNACNQAGEAGFNSIGIDLIYGIPGQKIMDWEESLRKAVLLRPWHISCYELTLENETPLGNSCRMGDLKKPADEICANMYMLADRLLKNAGYIHYEVSNYALGEKNISIHNSSYWEHRSYIGLGPSAHGFDGQNRRWWNVSDIRACIRMLEKGHLPVGNSEILTKEQLATEYIMLALRTAAGFDLNTLEQHYNASLSETARTLLAKLVIEGKLTEEGPLIRPTAEGMLLADGIASGICHCMEV